SACEPCNGSVIGLPPPGSVALVTPPADGGCVRTRFFNGMFITREDLETEQRYHRLKSRLHNRAAGAGVVWGLGVGRQGDRVCVLPGYAVDCCASAPIARFLDEVRALRERFPAGAEPGGAVPDRAPFRLRVTVTRPDGSTAQTDPLVRPSPQTTSLTLPGGPVKSLKVDVLPDPL